MVSVLLGSIDIRLYTRLFPPSYPNIKQPRNNQEQQERASEWLNVKAEGPPESREGISATAKVCGELASWMYGLAGALKLAGSDWRVWLCGLRLPTSDKFNF